MTKFIIITFNLLIYLVFLGNDACIFVDHRNNTIEKPFEVTSANLLAVTSIVNFGKISIGTTKNQDIKFTNESNLMAHECELIGLSVPFVDKGKSHNSIPAQKTISFSISVEPKIPGISETKIALVCRNAQKPAFVTLKVEVNDPIIVDATAHVKPPVFVPDPEIVAVIKPKEEETISSKPSPPPKGPPPMPMAGIIAGNQAKIKAQKEAEQQAIMVNKINNFFETQKEKPINFSEKIGMIEISLIAEEEIQKIQENTQILQNTIRKSKNSVAKNIAQAKLKNNLELIENLLAFNKLKAQREQNIEKIKNLNTNFEALSKHPLLVSFDYVDLDKNIIYLSKLKNQGDLEKEIKELNTSITFLENQIKDKEGTDLIEIKQQLGETWPVLVSKIKTEMIPTAYNFLKEKQTMLDEIHMLKEKIIIKGEKIIELDENLKKLLSFPDDEISLTAFRERYLDIQQEANHVKKSAEYVIQEQESIKEKITELKMSVLLGKDVNQDSLEKKDPSKGSKEQANLVNAIKDRIKKDQRIILEEDFLKSIDTTPKEPAFDQE